MCNQENFGRPEDNDIEKQFMKKIRGDKLQAINAECQLQICLAFHEGKKEKKKPLNRNKNVPENQPKKIDLQQIGVMQIDGLLMEEREWLMEQFKNLKDAWQFQEIQDGHPLPDYFFDDGCDLSYIIYSLQDKQRPKGNSEQKTSDIFRAEELLFLEFLCLGGRGHLNTTILEYYNNNMDFLINAMNVGLEKIRNKRSTAHENSKKNENQEQMMNEGESNSNQDMEGSDQIDEKEKSLMRKQTLKAKEKQPSKTKPIKKGGKKAKGKGKKKKNESESEEEGQEEVNENYPKEKQLAIKTCNYISWAYWYVIKKK